MKQKIDGIIPVMLTPFDDQGAIDWGSLEALIEWYLEKSAEGVDAFSIFTGFDVADEMALRDVLSRMLCRKDNV